MERDKELWDALDRMFFGSNEPEKVREGIRQLEKELAWQRSSLGRYLRSLRRSHKRSLAEMAYKARVDRHVWKAWEHDFQTPTKEELEAVMERLRWSRLQREQIWKLWEEAARFRLRRLTSFQVDALAAKGVAWETNIAWESVDEVSQAKIRAWGEEHGYDFPKELSEFLSTLSEEERRDEWVDEILGGAGGE